MDVNKVRSQPRDTSPARRPSPQAYSQSSVEGNSNTASAAQAKAWGIGSIASGPQSSAHENATYASGTGSDAGGNGALDRGRYGANCWSSSRFAASGDAQECRQELRGSGSSASAIRLTADGGAAGTANCVNIPASTAYGVTISLQAIDKTAPTNSFNARWTSAHSLTRSGAASTTLLDGGTSAVAADVSKVVGAVTPAVSLTPDTTNACLNLSFTPPSGNTDTWDVFARVGSDEVQ